MRDKDEQKLTKRFADVKMESSKPGTFGTYGILWVVKEGQPISMKIIREETETFSRSE